MNQITVMGIVISSAPISEYDKRVVILTRERGKIAAFARGARRPGNSLSGMLEPFSFGEFTLHEGRNSYTVSSASISNYFAKLRTDVSAAYYGFYFMEIADYYCKEAVNETAMLKLLYQTFRALTKPNIDNRLIRRVFELRAISINGEAPHVSKCVVCGDDNRRAIFSVKKGGRVCEECQKDVFDGMILDTSTWHTLQYIVSAPIERLYTFRVTENIQKELDLVIERYMDVYVDKRFKSLEILELMT